MKSFKTYVKLRCSRVNRRLRSRLKSVHVFLLCVLSLLNMIVLYSLTECRNSFKNVTICCTRQLAYLPDSVIDKPNAKSQSVFHVHWWTKKLTFLAGGHFFKNLFPVFSLSQDRQLRRLT